MLTKRGHPVHILMCQRTPHVVSAVLWPRMSTSLHRSFKTGSGCTGCMQVLILTVKLALLATTVYCLLGIRRMFTLPGKLDPIPTYTESVEMQALKCRVELFRPPVRRINASMQLHTAQFDTFRDRISWFQTAGDPLNGPRRWRS